MRLKKINLTTHCDKSRFKFLLGVISVFSILSCLKGVSDTELNDNTYGKPNKRNTADTVNIVNCHLLTEETTFHALMLYMSHLIVIHLTLMDTTFAVGFFILFILVIFYLQKITENESSSRIWSP